MCFNWAVKSIDKTLKLFKPKMESKYKIKFLEDVPLTADEILNVKFGHEKISSTLASIIQRVQPPFTIGLFGRWGTGKSTIVKILKNQLSSKDIPLVEFDAWKYKKDSLRRQFLITLDTELNLKQDYRRKLNQNLSEPFILPPIKTVVQILSYLVPSLIFFTIVVVAILLFRYFFNITGYLADKNLINETLLRELFSFSIVGIFINMILTSVSNVSYGSTQINKTDSAEGFEYRFYEEVLPRLKDKEKVIVAIDNLDRVDSESAVSLLSDIKTFLSKDDKKDNKFIFLIVCDDYAIKKHLRNKKFDDPDEFIRKFFNTSVNIPIFLDLELDSYTKDLLVATGSTKLSKNSNLISLITYAYRNNPREIKQFINVLLAEYLLVQKMQPKNSSKITNNIEFLAKIMIIKQKMNNVYKNIEDLAIRYGFTWDQINNHENSGKLFEGVKNDEQSNYEDFINATNHIQSDIPSLFIRLKQSDEEVKLPKWEPFIVASLDKNISDAERIFANFVRNHSLAIFDSLLLDYFRKISRRGKHRPYGKIWEVGSTTGIIGKYHVKEISNSLNYFIDFMPNQADLLSRWSDFPPSIYFGKIIQILDKHRQKKLIDSYLSITLLDDKERKYKEQMLDLLRVVINNSSYFDGKLNVIKDYLDKYPEVEFLELIYNSNLYKELLSDTGKELFVSSINETDMEAVSLLDRKLSMVNKLYE